MFGTCRCLVPNAAVSRHQVDKAEMSVHLINSHVTKKFSSLHFSYGKFWVPLKNIWACYGFPWYLVHYGVLWLMCSKWLFTSWIVSILVKMCCRTYWYSLKSIIKWPRIYGKAAFMTESIVFPAKGHCRGTHFSSP